MDFIGIGIGLVVGIGIGYALATILGNKDADTPALPSAGPSRPDWWQTREQLTGTQLQILQYMEANKEVSITGLQEKFSFIPDRELYYRLEQIVLMQFLERERKEGEVFYVLNAEYSGTVEGDKTVMLGSD